MTDPFGQVPVVFAKLTGKTRGFVCLGSDYEPIVVLNQNLTYEQQVKTYRHELEHLRRGDMDDPVFMEYGD